MDDTEAMGARLKQARKLAGIDSAAEAARRLRMREPTYSAHENGSRGFKRPEALKYARAFKVDLEWLLYGFGSPRGPGIMDKIVSLSDDRRRDAERHIDWLLEQESRDRKASRETR